MQMHSLDRYTALAQVWLSALYLVGLFTVIILYMLGFARMGKEQEESFRTFVSFLTAGGLIVLYFWFQRARTSGASPPPAAPDNQQP